MRNCRWEPCEGGVRCCQCGTVRRTVRNRNCDVQGIGTKIAQQLERVGITEQRVSAILRRPCGCKQRASWLDRLVPFR